jgi:hypothetical protein
MESKRLEPWQAQRVRDALFPLMNYVQRLRRRMEQAFPPDDKLLVLVCKLYDSLHELYNELHYQTCESGVGREPAK